MKKILVALISVLLLCTAFAGCSTGINDTEETFTIYAEAGYLDKAEIETGFSEYYKAQTGLDIKTEVLFYEDADKMIKEVSEGKIVCDLILAKDYAAQTLITNDKVQGIVDANGVTDEIENFANIAEFMINMINNEIEYDRANQDKLYSVPFSFRTQGVLYNKSVPSAERGSLLIFGNEEYKGKIAIDNDYRLMYAFGSIFANIKTIIDNSQLDGNSYQNALDKAINNFDYSNRESIKEMLKGLEKQGSYSYAENSAELVASGKKDVAMCWSNEAVKAMNSSDKQVKMVFENIAQGGIFEANAFVMPKKANNKQEAVKFLNYILQDEVSISQMKYSGNTSALGTKAIINEFEDEAVEPDNYAWMFDTMGSDLSLANGYYPNSSYDEDANEINKLAQLNDMGENREDVVSMINGVTSNTLLIVLIVVIGVIILGVAGFLIYYVAKKSKANAEKKEKQENTTGYRK